MSVIHWVIVAAIVFLLFGAGKLPRLMGEFAEGIKAFKKGMKDDAPSKLEDKSETKE
jgi:sec-independent protein translocase protein TatA